jgi:putative flavoprotein involved in K+ transport
VQWRRRGDAAMRWYRVKATPVFGDDGEPVHDRGVVGSEPGLYFVGLPFQSRMASDLLPGVAIDAAYVARQLARRSRDRRAPVAANAA